MLIGTEKVIMKERPDIVLVEGDDILGDTVLVFLDDKENIRLLKVEEFAELHLPDGKPITSNKEAMPVKLESFISRR